jgi:hypothetical protein
MMPDFSPDQARRWEAWQHANAISARRTDRICGVVASTVAVALLIAVGVAVARL